MTTVMFYRMKIQPTERTPIEIIPAAVDARCPTCHRTVKPNRIVSSHARPLDVCPFCNTYISGDQPEDVAEMIINAVRMRDYLRDNPNRIVSFDELRTITHGSRPYLAKLVQRVRRQYDMLITNVRGRGYTYVPMGAE